MRRIVMIILAFVLPFAALRAQVTTGTLTGTAKSNTGEALTGATVTAIHTPTGSKYSTVATTGGQYRIPNLRIGGPYKITIHFVGYGDAIFEDVNIALGTPLVLDAVLSTTAETLTEVQVVGNRKGSVINSQRTGTSTMISSRQMQSMPTINRSVQDFARLTPQVKSGNQASSGNTTGLSFAGQSNRYNQFSIDGANASDAFGLGSSGTNGGQANVNPISIEAIQEVQIVLSPYDVTQGGFTGGGINAITKSGTNTLHGSVYGQYQNEGFIGKSSKYNDVVTRNSYGDFSNKTFGASLGGALVKNKLFFFAAVERFERSTPLAFDPTVAGSGSRANADTLEAIRQFLITKGYDPGTYGAINNDNQSTSVFARLDWNISDKHKLTLRHNYVNGSNDVLSRSATSPTFSNLGYKFTDKANTTVLELNSTFSSSKSNVLRLTYNRVRDERASGFFPNVFVSNYDAVQKTNISYNLGSDYSSAANSLDQDVFTITDNFTLYKGKHTMTFGTNNEFFKSSNVFLQGYLGAYTYNISGSSNNLNNFYNNTGMTQYQVGYSTAGRGDKAPADLKAAQLAVYAQDVWSVTKSFKLTYGLRIDLPVISTKPAENAAFNTDFAAFDVKTNQMPKTAPLFSPRIGFNWDVTGNATLQIRGGAGIFTGRVPFVWISNQLSNTGVATKNITLSTAQLNAAGVKYTYDPKDAQAGAYIPATTANAPTAINVIDKDFKFPQIFRANLGIDKKLGGGFVATIEGVFTKNINNGAYTNLNISENGEGTVAIGSTTRPLWTKYTNPNYLQVIKLGNTSKGYAVSITGQLQKTFSQGWAGSIAYTYGKSTSINDLPSSVALSNWRGTQTVNGLNRADITTSNYNMGSRVVGYVSKEFKYLKHFATTLTLIYTGQSGQRLSYLYNNFGNKNITGDDNGASSTTRTSLAYIPANMTEANFADITNGATASQQWADFQAFAKSNKYIEEHMGQNTQRNGDKLPWENHFDFRVAQDFMLKGHKLQIFYDIVNVGALLNHDWGRSYGIDGGSDGFFPVQSVLFTPVTGAQKQDGVNITPTTANPAYQFNINNFTKIGDSYRPYNISDFTSRFTSQLGLRYSF